MKILAVIQARCGSTRLPDKVLLPLEGRTVLEHVINRVKNSKKISDLIVATTTLKKDLKIVKLCETLKVKVFCGSENDVLDRFYFAAKPYSPKHIVRITADCPLIDSKIIDEVIEKHLKTNADYTSNVIEETYPDGEDVEVFTFKALRTAFNESVLPSEREHVTPYIKKHPELFKLVSVKHKKDLSKKRWTLDNAEDYEFIKKIYEKLYPLNNFFGINEILNFLEKNKYLEKINVRIIRNEGYKKSLKKEKFLLKKAKIA